MAGLTLVDLAGRVIVALALAAWLYRDARGRDYSWLMWTLTPVMLIFLPRFAWVFGSLVLLGAYLGLRPRGKLLRCPHCKKMIHDELAFCGFCRRSVKRECLKCHRTVPWEAVTCPHCRSTAITDT